MPPPARDRPRSSALQLVGVALTAVGVAITLFVLVAIGLPDTRGTAVEAAAGVLVWAVVVGIAVLPIALGAWLVERGAPGAWRTILRGAFARQAAPRDAVATGPRQGMAGHLRWLLLDPVGLCVLLPVLALVPAWLGAAGAMVALLALTTFAVLHPALCAWRPPWWARTALGAVVFLATIVGIGLAPSITDLREGATVFMVPAMVYPAAIAASGAARLALWLRKGR